MTANRIFLGLLSLRPSGRHGARLEVFSNSSPPVFSNCQFEKTSRPGSAASSNSSPPALLSSADSLRCPPRPQPPPDPRFASSAPGARHERRQAKPFFPGARRWRSCQAPSAEAHRGQLALVVHRRRGGLRPPPGSTDPHRLGCISPLAGKEARSDGLLRGLVPPWSSVSTLPAIKFQVVDGLRFVRCVVEQQHQISLQDFSGVS